MTEARAISDGRVDLKALIEAAKAANRGPWEVYTEEHPWELPERELLGKSMPAASGIHKERWIITSWEHGQAHAKMPIVGGSSGIGVNGQPVHMVHIDEADARFIALANPSTVAAMAEELMADRQWRDLALQFDGHRIEALAMLRYVSEAKDSFEAMGRIGEIRPFLAKPPLSGEAVLADRIAAIKAAAHV